MRNNVTTIPGTTTTFPPLPPGAPPELHTAAEQRQRKGLLAKIHVARAQMGLNEGEYEMVLRSFRVTTAAHLTIPQLENMVKLLRSYGWKPTRPWRTHKRDQVPALRARCLKEAERIPNGAKRLAGLAQKICGTAQLAWCHDAEKLERLLAVLGKIRMNPQEGYHEHHE
jgi:phage gp16-like protein